MASLIISLYNPKSIAPSPPPPLDTYQLLRDPWLFSGGAVARVPSLLYCCSPTPPALFSPPPWTLPLLISSSVSPTEASFLLSDRLPDFLTNTLIPFPSRPRCRILFAVPYPRAPTRTPPSPADPPRRKVSAASANAVILTGCPRRTPLAAPRSYYWHRVAHLCSLSAFALFIPRVILLLLLLLHHRRCIPRLLLQTWALFPTRLRQCASSSPAAAMLDSLPRLIFWIWLMARSRACQETPSTLTMRT